MFSINLVSLKSFFRLSALVILGHLFIVAASAQDAESTSEEVNSADEAEAVSLPDPAVLKRLQSFRGPYRTPVLASSESRAARTTAASGAVTTGAADTSSVISITNDLAACRPPQCRYDETRVVLKLSSDLTSAKLAQSRTSGGTSPLDAASLTPVFAKEAVASATSRMARSAAVTPSNSRGGQVDLSRWYEMTVPAGADIADLIQELDLDDRVEVAEPIYERGISAGGPTATESSAANSTLSVVSPNDPKKPDQWHLASTRVEEAWQWLEDNGHEPWGDRSIVVAVIDSGVDYTHEDLAGNMWTNGGEIPDNNIDDDNNGFVDDIYGVSVVGSTYDHKGDPQDDNGHGTHVAGIIAAQGNNSLGVIGVAPNVRIMAIKAAQYSGVLTSTDILEAILYAYQQGADVINMSFGGSGRSVLEEEALAVAFGNAALIAAAGNNGAYNDTNCGPFARPSYPAAYSYVLGVMAEQPSAAINGDWLAGFSNWDCVPQNALEYEVMAPGVDIWSTTPQNGYAAWDGTSMAAPVVAGMAALLRTHFSDKSLYSSRFIMGQLGATGAFKQGITHCETTCNSVSFRSADTLTALTEVPTPKLAYLEHWLWDGSEQSTSNDDDGIVDAGETIELAIVIKNYWGMADNVTVTLSAQAANGAFQPDPYVTFEADSVNYGGVGSFAQDDNGLVYDEGGLVNGVNVPFRFSVAADTPNEHIIPMVVTMTASNGLDPTDTTLHTTESRFSLIVQRGRELPPIIDGDAVGTPGGDLDTDGVEDGVVTLDDSILWLIDRPVQVLEGTTLKIGPGAQIQWWSSETLSPYGSFAPSVLYVDGELDITGSAASPAHLYASDLWPSRIAQIELLNQNVETQISYARLSNSFVSAINDHSLVYDHVHFYAARNGLRYSQDTSSGEWGYGYYSIIPIAGTTLRNSRVTDWGYDISSRGGGELSFRDMSNVMVNDSVFTSSMSCAASGPDSIVDSVFYANVIDSGRSIIKTIGDTCSFTNNAVLNPWFELDLDQWLFLAVPPDDGDEESPDFSSTYWGTSSSDLIGFAVRDAAEILGAETANLEPVISSPLASTYPFVATLSILDADGNNRSDNRFAAEPTIWRVTFNRDMDTTIQPQVSFGPDVPYTDYTVGGDWLDARTWQGNVTIAPIATDGYQFIRVAGAVAADDPWLVTGDDKRRFRFEVITSGTESLNMQATGGEGYVDLSWSQDDYDTLQGFNIYRSTSADSGFIRINQTLVGNSDRAFRDDYVDPGVQYYYHFTVALDGAESEPSNTASATPIDTVAPTLTHSPITSADYGSSVLIDATATDNISVSGVMLYYRAISDTAFQSLAMLNTSGSTYRASIPADVVTNPGVEYYLSATDGSSTSYSGRDTSPHQITVLDAPVLTSVSPTAGSSAGGETLTISGTNFSAGIQVTLGGGACEQVTVVSSSRITCITPAHIPEAVSLTVENTQGYSDTLTNAFTYVGNATTLSLPDVEGAAGETIEVALSVGPVAGLTSFFASVTWDTTDLEFIRVVKGPLIPGWDMTAAEPTAGQVNIAASSANNLAGSGTLVVLEFNVLASETGSSAIQIASARLNDEAISVTLANGSFTFFSGYSLGGSVQFWDTQSTAIDATLTLDDSATTSSSGSSGAYSFADVGAGQHTIRAAKSDGVNDSVRVLDASLILSHVVGTATLTGHALTAADTNANGQVTEQDAAKVLEVAAGLRALPFANHTSPWQFSPAEHRYNNFDASINNADFVGIFIGDVSGNWPSAGISGGSPVELEVSGVTANAVTVDFYATPAAEVVSAVEVTIQTTAGASLTDVALDPALNGWSTPLITPQSGGDYISTYSDVSKAFSGRTKVLSLTFSVSNTEQKVTQLSGWLNETPFTDAMSFALAEAKDTDGDGVPDHKDAFPNDPAASIDTDGDGMPDDWNPGYSAADSTTSLTLDEDDDNDGYTDAEEVEAGSDPLDANDEPSSTGLPVWLLYQATQ